MKFEIEKTLVSSTSHVMLSDINILLDKYINSVIDYEYGIVLNIGCGIESINEFELLSEEAKTLILFSVSMGCNYLKLDSDGPIYNDFPTHDW